MSPALLVHIAAGAFGIMSGAVAVAVRKGGRTHRTSGRLFVASMLAMGAAAAFLSVSLPDWANFPGALFALYLVATGWAAVIRNAIVGRSLEHVALVIGGAAAACALLLAFQANSSASGVINGKPAALFGILSGLAIFSLAMDLSVMRSAPAQRSRPIARHIWRMCTALFFGTGSFFLGQQQTLPGWIQGSPALFVLALAPLALMVIWLVKTIKPGSGFVERPTT